MPATTDEIRRDPIGRLACCLGCGSGLAGHPTCPTCGRPHPVVGGILEAIGPLEGTNRVASAFYDGSGWRRFRPYEQMFLWFQGNLRGRRAARRQILRHLDRLGPGPVRVLEVGIGDGDNLPLLPAGWEVFGVDIARTQLAACVRRFPKMAGTLGWAEGEALPFAAGTFDAVYSIGGFNYFRDHAAALAEMRRVARPGAPVVVADERPDLYRFSIFYQVGLPDALRWSLVGLGLDPEFVAMVLSHRTDIDAIARSALPDHRRFPIWNRLGYCLVDPAPDPAVRGASPWH